MKHLYKENIQSFLNKSFNLSEKIDGSCLWVKVVNGQIIFLNRGKKEITEIDRWTNSIYELAISWIKKEFSKLSTIELINLHDTEFCFEVINSIKPNLITYDRVPGGNCVLTGVWFNGISLGTKILPNLDFERLSPIIEFDIICPELIELFKSRNIQKIFEYYDYVPFLGGKKSEGLVLEVDDQLYKITEKDFTTSILNKEKDFFVDSIKRTILEILFLEFDLPKRSEFKTTEEFLIHIYDLSINSALINMLTKKFNLPHYIKPNKSLIGFEPSNPKLFCLIVNSFKSPKKRVTSIIDKQLKEKINKLFE